MTFKGTGDYEKKKSERPKPKDRSPGQPMTDIEVAGGVAEGTHVPFVALTVAGQTVRMSVGDALNMAGTLYQSAAMAYQDAMLVGWLQASITVEARDPLQAYQGMISFQQFRAYVARQQRAMAQAAAGRAAPQPEQPQDPGVEDNALGEGEG